MCSVTVELIVGLNLKETFFILFCFLDTLFVPVVLQTRALDQSVDAKYRAGLTMYFSQVVRLVRVNTRNI